MLWLAEMRREALEQKVPVTWVWPVGVQDHVS